MSRHEDYMSIEQAWVDRELIRWLIVILTVLFCVL